MREKTDYKQGKLKRLGVTPQLVNHRSIDNLERSMHNWSEAEIFYQCTEPQIAEKLVQITLCHTYLFGRFALLSYAGHLFMSLRDLPPADDLVGKVLKSNAAVFEGELFTNNIFGRQREGHSHYLDMLESYEQTGGDKNLVHQFTERERQVGIDQAMEESSLWDNKMTDYANHLREVTKDPLTTYLIILASEDTIAEGYKTTLENLNTDPKFVKYRIFMRRHILLDQENEGHGKASVDWVNFYLETFKPSTDEINRAIHNTIEFIQKRLVTYAIT